MLQPTLAAPAVRGLRPLYAKHGVSIFHADAREVLKRIPDRSIDFVFTDPPYGADQNTGDLNARLSRRRGKPARAIAGDGRDQADRPRRGRRGRPAGDRRGAGA